MRFWKKTISVLLIHAFLLSSLPAGTLQPAFAVAPDSPEVTAKEITTNPEEVIISRDYGIVKSKFVGKGDRLIVHIQDAHCNYEAQSNIAKIIEGLVKNNSLSFVSVEGADGLIDTSWFKAFPDAEVRKEVANYFMKKGEITGPEFLSITTDYPIKLFGAETREYYIQNLNAFTASYPSKDETEKYLNGIKSVLSKLQNFIYNADLKAMDTKAREHDSKAIQFNEYVRFLQSEAEGHKINLRQYENLFKLINVLIYEKKIDFSVTDKERSAVIDELSKVLPKDTLTELVNKSISFKVGKISSSEYYEYLRNLATKNGIELLQKYPNLSNYIIYNSVYSKIDNEKLFNDIKEVEAAIKEKLFENEDQRTLERLTRHIDTLLGLINIKLLNGEFDYYKTHKEEFTPESFTDFMKAKSIQFGLAYETEPPSDTVADSISKLEDFYAIAIKRDKALVDNTLEGMKKADQKMAVLVTGGFHSEGMAKLLEKQGISYIVVCPNITKDVPTPYIQVLTNQRTSFEDILTAPQEPVKQNMLAPVLVSWARELTPKEREGFSKIFLSGSMEDKVEDFESDWIEEHLSLWLGKVLHNMEQQHIMLRDPEILRAAYRMAMEHSFASDDLLPQQARDVANHIMSSELFIEKFDQVFNAIPASAVVGAGQIVKVKAELPKGFPENRYEWARGPEGEDLTGFEIWDKANHTKRFRYSFAKRGWHAYSGGMAQLPIQMDGVKIEIGDNMPPIEVKKISDDKLLLKNLNTNKELNISIVKTMIAGHETCFCIIGSRTYEAAGNTIVLPGLLRHENEQDILGWIGNQALLDLFEVQPERVLSIPSYGRPIIAKPYLFDSLQEPVSRITNPDFFPPNPNLKDLEAARKYLTDKQYDKNAPFEELITRLHYTAVLSRSNISIVKDYRKVVEDLSIVTENLMKMELNNNLKVSKVAKGIFNSISLAIVKGKRPVTPELLTPKLTSKELERLRTEEPFVIEYPDKDIPRLNAVVANLVLEGKWKPYVLVNIKNFSGTTHIAYAKFVEAISKKYNGNITFILSVEDPRALRGDLAGTYTARRRAIDALGDDFWLKERVITEPDGGEKTRAANAGVAFEQWSKALTSNGVSFLEENILTGSSIWLLLPKLGKGNQGQNYKPWLASDGKIRFGKMNLGGKPMSQVPDDLKLAACGLDALVMTPDQMDFVRTSIYEKAAREKVDIDETFFEKELENILFTTTVGEEIRANIDKRELIKRGIFVVDENGVMSGFLEKGGGEQLPLKKRYVNLASIAYRLGNGKVLENLWFILEDSRTSLDIIKRFATTRTDPASKEEIIGRVPGVSSFQEMFQGTIYEKGRPWEEQVRQALGSKKLYGISYGEGVQAADIASIENYFEMWERYVREYKGDKEIDLDVAEGVKIAYRGDKNKLSYLLRNVKIIGSGILEIGDGVVIQGGTIAVNGTLVIPDRTKIIDSQLLGDLEFRGESAMVLAASFEPLKYTFLDNGVRIDKLVIYGDETTTTQTYQDKTTHTVRFINSFDYKGKIYQIVGGKDRWAAIREKLSLRDKVYENFDDVARFRLGNVVLDEYKWAELVKFIFAPTLSMEELYRVNSVINNLGREFAEKRINDQTLREKIADALKTMVSARFTLTDQETFQRDVDNIFNIAKKPLGTWSHQDIDEIIAQSYRNKSMPQIEEALKKVTYDKVKEDAYCKAFYRILASMHPAIITDVDHGPLSWNAISAGGEEKAFHNLSLYGGERDQGDAKRAIGSFEMAWVLGTRTTPAATHVDFTTPIRLFGDEAVPVGAVRGNGEGVSAEEHGTRTLGNANYDRNKVAQENSLNGIIARRFDADNGYGSVVYSVSLERDAFLFPGDKIFSDMSSADFNTAGEQDRAKLLKRKLIGENVTFIVIKGLKDELLRSGITPDLIFHPGVTRHAIYMDEGDFNYLLSLENAVDLIMEAVKHEMTHMKYPDMKEAEVEAKAPTYNVRAAMTLKDVTGKMASMDIESRQFEVGKEYEPGKVYQKPLAKFAKFGTSGVRWLVSGVFKMFENAAEKVKAGKSGITEQDREFARKYDVLVSNHYTQADFTMPNIGLVAKSIALYNLRKAQGMYEPVVGTTEDFRKKLDEKGLLLFYDNRPGNFEYVAEIARILTAYGIKVTLNKTDGKFTPVLLSSLSLIIKREGYAGGMYLTASHNGDEWNGIKFNAEDGAPSMPKVTDAIGAILAEEIGRENPGYDRAGKDVEGLIADGKIATMDATEYYVDSVLKYMGPERVEAVKRAIMEKKVVFIYSAFYGSSGLAMKKLFERLGIPEENIIEIEKPGEGVYIPGYEPTLDKLKALKKKVDKVATDIRNQGRTPIVIGGSADNDADRFQVNENGEEYIPGRLTAILGHYLVTSRNLRGKDIQWGRSFVSSRYPDEVAKLFGQSTQIEPTGFKFSPSVLAKGGIIFYEESYGQSFWDWTLDKDGVLPSILALELVATTGKSLEEYEKGIKDELKAAGLLSEFHFERDDKRLPGDVKDNAVKLFKEFYNGIVVGETTFAGKKITEKYDSAKFGGMEFIMEDGSWIALRSSGTEPVIRLYMEAKDAAAVNVLRYAAVILMELNHDIAKIEAPAGVEIAKKLHTPLDAKGDKAVAAGFLKAGYNRDGKTANIGYGVEEGAVIDGSFATEGEGVQGYYVDRGKQFLSTVKDMRDFFARRARILGKSIKYVIKPGIGGQHTPFQGIAEVFQVIDAETGMVVGEYELGKNYEEALGKVLAELGADWDQIAVIPSSKSGSTDETMMIFSEVLYTLLKKIAEKQGLNGEQFADTVFNTLHDINFENGVERKGADLFKGFSLKLLINKLNAIQGFKTDYIQVRSVFAIVLGNMFFETTDRPSQSRLAAFIKNSGLDQELGEDAPGFGAMFDNVGGRWTADLHMMTFLAYHKMTDEQIMAYWQSRYEGIEAVRNGTHLANNLAAKILDEGITDIALVVPDELFWFGKSIEQNFNESIWQKGFANLVTVKESMWRYQKSNYANKPKRLVVCITSAELDMEGCDLFKEITFKAGTKVGLAKELGRLSTTFYGTTYTVGTRLIARALAREGYTWADVDINDLNNPATRIMQRNLYLRQPYVELGKGLLEAKLGDLQKAGPEAVRAEVAKIQDAAKNGRLTSNVKELGLPDTVTDMQTLAQTIFKAVKFAEKENRKFVPFIYLEGEKFYELREALVKLGIEWVMQGTGDQHISYQQVLAQPQKYLPFIISFVPENMLPGRPAIGFAKGYLNNVSSNMVRDLFAEASYRALTEPRTDEEGKPVYGAKGIFLRMQDSQGNRSMLKESFKEAVTGPRAVEVTITPMTAEKKPALAREEYIYDTYVKEDATALHQTLVGLGINTELMRNKKVLLVYDTALDPTVDTAHVARAGEVAVNKYMNDAIIEVRGTGKALHDMAKAQAGSLKGPYTIVTIAGDATLKTIGSEGLKDLGKVINVQNPDGRYIPVIGLYDLALRIAYDLGDEKILECLNRIAINDPLNPTPWTSEDLKKGVIRILPKIRPVDMAEAVEAYKAAQAALASL